MSNYSLERIIGFCGYGDGIVDFEIFGGGTHDDYLFGICAVLNFCSDTREMD